MPVSFSPAMRLGLLLIASALTVITLGGCATHPSQFRAARPAPSRNIPTHAGLPGPPAAQSMPVRLFPVERFGRYTLIEISPAAAQADLMQQIVDVSMPPTLVASVGDAVRYVLLRSGFTLCDSAQIRIFNTLPLPAADFELGPLTLESALQILVGPAWRLEVNEITRRVCFVPLSPPSPSGRSTRLAPRAAGDAPNAARAVVTTREHRP